MEGSEDSPGVIRLAVESIFKYIEQVRALRVQVTSLYSSLFFSLCICNLCMYDCVCMRACIYGVLFRCVSIYVYEIFVGMTTCLCGYISSFFLFHSYCLFFPFLPK